jgi:hypothetical protein
VTNIIFILPNINEFSGDPGSERTFKEQENGRD